MCTINTLLNVCTSCVQCEKFNLATLIPFKINSFITFGSLLAGPKVQTNFDLQRFTKRL